MKAKVSFIGRLIGLACIAGWLVLQSPAALLSSSTPPRSIKYRRADSTTPTPPETSIAKERVAKLYNELPLSFEACDGNADSEVKFLARGRGYNVYLTAKEAVMEFSAPSSTKHANPRSIDRGAQSSIVGMRLVGANPMPEIAGVDEMPGKSNFFIGSDPNRWRAAIQNYSRVKYADIYPGVDVVFHGKHRQLEYDFIVAPGADSRAIRMRFAGARKMRISRNGDLVLQTPAGEIRHCKPVAYQHSGTSRYVIRGRYVIHADRSVGFEIAPYDKTKQLTIDPVVSYSTYLGGTGAEAIYAIAVDSSGNAYLTGQTNSINFPTTPGSFRRTGGGFFAFVTKLNLASNTLSYSTYIGGQISSRSLFPQTIGQGVAVDSKGNLYVAGRTSAIDFPTTPGAFQPTWSGTANFSVPTNAFVTKLNQDGSALVYSTYLGGSHVPSTIVGSASETGATAIAVDGLDFAYVTGSTNTLDFPTTTSALQSAKTGNDLCSGAVDAQRPCSEGFVTKLNQSGTALVYSTYLGGNGDEVCNGIAIDSAGNAYVTGTTNASFSDAPFSGGRKPFPTASPLQPTSGGGSDAFVSKLNADATALIYSTYLGGGANDSGNCIAVDVAGNAYVVGTASSTDLPVTTGAFQTASAGVTLFKTTDGGMVWKASNKGLPSDSSIELLAIDRVNPATIYAASYGSIFSGVFKSVDGGSTWNSNVGKEAFAGSIVVVAFDSQNPSTSYAVFNDFSNAGLSKSVDGGRTFSSLPLPFPFTGLAIGELAIDPTDSSVLYVGTRFKSSDGGFRWKQIGKGLPGFGAVLAIDPTNSSILYAKVSTVGGQPTGLFRSASGGKKWNATDLSNVSIRSVAFDPLNRSRLYAGGDGLFKSDDGGVTWKAVKSNTTLPAVLQLLVDPINSSIIYARTVGGFFKSQNRGKDWIAANAGLPDVALYAAIDPKNPSNLYAGIRPRGADAFVAKLNAAGSAFAYLTYLGGGNQDQATGIAIDHAGGAYVAGVTESSDFPTKNALQSAKVVEHIGHPFLTRLSFSGADVDFSTYLGGGANVEAALGVALDPAGSAYVVGLTESPDFPTTAVAFQKIYAGAGDGFLMKLDSTGSASFSAAESIAKRARRSLELSGNSGRRRK